MGTVVQVLVRQKNLMTVLSLLQTPFLFVNQFVEMGSLFLNNVMMQQIFQTMAVLIVKYNSVGSV